MKQLILIIACFLATNSFAQSGSKYKEVKVQSSIVCEMCVKRLDNMFAEYYAVKDVDYNLKDKTITVVYNSKKTNPEKIREKINSVGYDADHQHADIEPYLDLAPCCKKTAAPH